MTRINVIFVSALRDENGLDLPRALQCEAGHTFTDALHCMTLFAAGSLMQVIDGEAPQARAELRRIFQSSHYLNTIVLNEEEVTEPSLCGNSLGALHLAPGVIEMLPEHVVLFSLNEGAVTQRVRSGIARNLLKQFAADYS